MIHTRGDYFAIYVYAHMPLHRTYDQLREGACHIIIKKINSSVVKSLMRLFDHSSWSTNLNKI